MFQRRCVHCRCVDKVFVGDSLCRFCKCKHEFTVIMIRKERVEQEGGQEDLTLDHKERKKEEILRIFSSSATSNCSRFKWFVNASISKLKYFFHFLYTHLQKVLPRPFSFVVGKKKRTGLGGLSRLQYKQD